MKNERTADGSLMKMTPQNDFYAKDKQTYTQKGGWFASEEKKSAPRGRVLNAKAKA